MKAPTMPSSTEKSYAQSDTKTTIPTKPSKRKASVMEDDADYEFLEQTPAPVPGTKKPRKSAAGRKLIRWSFVKDQELLMALEYCANRMGMTLPFDEACELLQPGATGQAALQHLSKLRKFRKEKNMWVPPELIKRRGRKPLDAQAQDNDGDDDEGDDQPFEGSTNRMIFIPLKNSKNGSGSKSTVTGATKSAISKQKTNNAAVPKQQTYNMKKNSGGRHALKMKQESEDTMTGDDLDTADPEQEYRPEGTTTITISEKMKRGRPGKTRVKEEALTPAYTPVGPRRATQNIDYREPDQDEEADQGDDVNHTDEHNQVEDDDDDSEYNFQCPDSKVGNKQMPTPIPAPKNIMQSVEAESPRVEEPSPFTLPDAVTQYVKNNFPFADVNYNIPVTRDGGYGHNNYRMSFGAPAFPYAYGHNTGSMTMPTMDNKSKSFDYASDKIDKGRAASSFNMSSGHNMYPPINQFYGTLTPAPHMPMADIPYRNYSMGPATNFAIAQNEDKNIQLGNNMQSYTNEDMQNTNNCNQNYPARTTPGSSDTQSAHNQPNGQSWAKVGTPEQQHQSHVASASSPSATDGTSHGMETIKPLETKMHKAGSPNDNPIQTQVQGAYDAFNPTDLMATGEFDINDYLNQEFPQDDHYWYL